MAVEQVEQLRLQRGAGTVGVEVGEERILGSSSTTVASSRVPSRSASAVLPDADRALRSRCSGTSTGRREYSYQVVDGMCTIERLELRLLRLPLVHFFETSFGRIDDQHFRPGARRRRRRATGSASASPTPIRTTAPRPPTPPGTSSRTSSRRCVLGRDVRASARGVPGAAARSAATTWRRPRSRWPRGTCTRGSAACRCARVLGGTRAARSRPACRSASRIRSTSWRRRSRRELAAGYQRIKIKIKPGWDVDAVERVRARFGAIPLMVDANAAYTLADADAPGGARRVRPDDDRAAARLRRHRAITRRCSGGCRRRSASTSRSTPSRIARRGDRASAPAASSTSSRAASAGIAESIRLHDLLRRARHSGVARRHARERASAARTTFTCRRCRISRCRATSPPAGATSSPISSSRRSRSTPTAPSRCPTGRASA